MISATYTCYSNGEVGNPSNVIGQETDSYLTNAGRWYTQESWSYLKMDAGETLAITTTGYTCTYFGAGKIDNVKIYGEFYYK